MRTYLLGRKMAFTNFLLLLLALPAFICGYPRPMLSIDGGAKPTEPNQYPWMMLLQENRVQLQGEPGKVAESICGSVLIRFPENNDSSDIALTAAHCVTNSDYTGPSMSSPSKVEEVFRWVYAGGHLWKEIIQQAEKRTVSRVEIHPKYIGGVGPYDIAILKLSEPLKFGDKIQGIELPRKGQVLTGGDEEKCIVAGWGRIRDKGEEKFPDSLMHMNVSVASASQCSSIVGGKLNSHDYSKIENDQSRWYCVYAGTSEQMKPSACERDSGGPLFCKDERNNWTTHGVASGASALGCDTNPLIGHGPSFYVKLDGHLEWINEKIKALSSV